MTPFREAVYHIVRQIPRGRVVSYGGVAALMGKPRAARGVGQALAALDDETEVPWWRVVNHNGEVSISNLHLSATLQRTLLRSEGVEFDGGGRVDWDRFGWDGESLDPYHFHSD